MPEATRSSIARASPVDPSTAPTPALTAGTSEHEPKGNEMVVEPLPVAAFNMSEESLAVEPPDDSTAEEPKNGSTRYNIDTAFAALPTAEESAFNDSESSGTASQPPSPPITQLARPLMQLGRMKMLSRTNDSKGQKANVVKPGNLSDNTAKPSTLSDNTAKPGTLSDLEKKEKAVRRQEEVVATDTRARDLSGCNSRSSLPCRLSSQPEA